MKTKEEIFNSHSWQELGAISPSKSFCLKAMDEYAKEVAIGFDKWRSNNYWQLNKTEGFYFRWDIGMEDRATSEQLFDKFKKETITQ